MSAFYSDIPNHSTERESPWQTLKRWIKEHWETICEIGCNVLHIVNVVRNVGIILSGTGTAFGIAIAVIGILWSLWQLASWIFSWAESAKGEMATV